MPTIDIALASYNGEKYISAQIDSIFANDVSAVGASLGKLIVSDNVSTDATAKIVRNICNTHTQVQLHINHQRGVIHNFNHALAHTDAAYVMLADQDDVWHNNKIVLSFQKMQELERQFGTEVPLLVLTDLAVTDHQLNVISPSFFAYQKIDPVGYVRPESMFLYNVAPGCTMMLNRRLLEMATPVPDGAVMHDWWLMLVAGVFGHIGHVGQATMFYRQHDNNQIGASVSSFWEKLFSPRRKLQLARKNLQDAIRQAKLFTAQFPVIPAKFSSTLTYLTEFDHLSRWQRVRGLMRQKIIGPTFWGRVLLYAVAVFSPVLRRTPGC
ncbi:glycosyltransferase family 2 protein [Undibacterium sp. CY21W]|uniref:glycosyltransferase family 2 protein n=1 Tax=Undibacterium sp. CY21W TaxID=2762293 RepID=UPI00164B7844|nr:glycosyltransferase family 2 protein [Undibacterium sp. CY21W]MBC3929281.1 glycosyltransferase family 2 protein [Undibacterium sp. CY21W]